MSVNVVGNNIATASSHLNKTQQILDNSRFPRNPHIISNDHQSLRSDLLPLVSHSTALSSPRARLSTVEEGDDYLQTPFGRGINHQLESQSLPINMLPPVPSQSHIDSCLMRLDDEVKHFKVRIMSNIGWKGEYEKKASRIERELEELKGKCQSLGFLVQYEKAILLGKQLSEQVEDLRRIIPHPPSNPTKPGSDARISEIRNLPENTPQIEHQNPNPTNLNVSMSSDDGAQRDVESESDGSRRDVYTSREDVSSVKRSLRNFRTRFYTFEQEFSKAMSKVNDTLEKTVSESHSNDALVERITELENKSKRFQSSEYLTKDSEVLKEMLGRISETLVACNRTDLICSDLCKENANLKAELALCNHQLSILKRELDEMKAESIVTRQEVQGLLIKDMNRLQVATDIHQDADVRSSSRSDTNIQGIHVIPFLLPTTHAKSVIVSTSI